MPAAALRGGQRIAHAYQQCVGLLQHLDVDQACLRGGFNAVVDRVFQQGLQCQWRDAGRGQGIRQVPADLQSGAETDLFNRQVAPGELELLVEGDRIARTQGGAKQVGKIHQQLFGLLGLRPDQ